MKKLSADIKYVVGRLSGYINDKEMHPAPDDVIRSWFEVAERLRAQRRKQVFVRVVRSVVITASAAAVIFFVGTRLTSYDPFQSEPVSIRHYAEMAMTDSPENSDDIVLMVSDNEHIVVDRQEVDIVYGSEGELTVNSDTITGTSAPSPETTVYNQLIVPKGRRSNLTLSDGTRVWVNSGTRVIYPREFRGNNREIIVEGEAYLEVAPNKDMPFTVIAKGFNVNVTGTSFNVSAYPSEQTSSVVLVEGHVTVNNAADQTVSVSPGQLVSITSDGVLGTPDNVDVAPYVSWINNMLIYKNEPLERVFRKLHLYYGRRFVLEPGVGEMEVSGKLDLKNEINDVLSVISYSAPLTFRDDNDDIRVSLRPKKQPSQPHNSEHPTQQ